ncbi:hypothetical protein ACHQM5_030182 [Ranunculus cassubicifolius]
MGEGNEKKVPLSEAEQQSPSIFIPEPWSEAAERITWNSDTSPPPISSLWFGGFFHSVEMIRRTLTFSIRPNCLFLFSKNCFPSNNLMLCFSYISFICGPKNSGKTTFSRLLVNMLLQRKPRPKGCHSLQIFQRLEHLQCKKVFYLLVSFRCIFFGDLSSKRDPEIYLKNIISLYDYFLSRYHISKNDEIENPRKRKRKSMLPLVINTPGWVKGTGYDLLVSMMRYISPTHVVQLRITLQNKNLPSGAFWLEEQKHEHEGFNLMEIYSARENSFGQSELIPKNAKHMRDLRMREYFQQIFPSKNIGSSLKELVYALCSHPPYQVPISSVKITHLHEEVPSSEIHRGLNATIVGLAVSSKGLTGDEVTPWCVGLGIVRAINLSRDLLYILTPVPHTDLVDVDLLLQGFLEIPTGWLEVQGCRSPYISENVLAFLGTCY